MIEISCERMAKVMNEESGYDHCDYDERVMAKVMKEEQHQAWEWRRKSVAQC